MSDLYSPDLDDSVIPISHITTFILENDKNSENQLPGLGLSERIQHIWRVLNEDEELREALDIEKMWERKSLRKSWAEAERLRKIGNSKYAGGRGEYLFIEDNFFSNLPKKHNISTTLKIFTSGRRSMERGSKLLQRCSKLPSS